MKHLLLQIVLFNLISCSSTSTQRDKVTFEVTLDTVNKNIKYKIANINEDTVFVGKSLHLIEGARDTIFLECYIKCKLINYNQFIIPEMISLTKGKSTIGVFKVLDINTMRNKKFFVRIFQIDDVVYFSKNTNPMTENIYLEYEFNNSILLKGFVTESN
jgi:hypothetical protein